MTMDLIFLKAYDAFQPGAGLRTENDTFGQSLIDAGIACLSKDYNANMVPNPCP